MQWQIRHYRSFSGRSDVSDWYLGLRPKGRAKVAVRIDYLRQQPRERWTRPHFDQLHGDGRGLGEIRIKLDRVQQRLFGMFGPERSQFTILLIAEEKNGRYSPPSAIGTSQTRKKEIDDGIATAAQWPPESSP